MISDLGELFCALCELIASLVTLTFESIGCIVQLCLFLFLAGGMLYVAGWALAFCAAIFS